MVASEGTGRVRSLGVDVADVEVVGYPLPDLLGRGLGVVLGGFPESVLTAVELDQVEPDGPAARVDCLEVDGVAAVDQHDRRTVSRPALGGRGLGRGSRGDDRWLVPGGGASSGWLRPQPVTARLAMRSAMAIERMGRMMVIQSGW